MNNWLVKLPPGVVRSLLDTKLPGCLTEAFRLRVYAGNQVFEGALSPPNPGITNHHLIGGTMILASAVFAASYHADTSNE